MIKDETKKIAGFNCFCREGDYWSPDVEKKRETKLTPPTAKRKKRKKGGETQLSTEERRRGKGL